MKLDEAGKIKEFIRIANHLRDEETRNFQFFGNRQILSDETDEDIEKANALLFDLENCPHAYTLACVMDLGIKFELAWIIPYKVFTAFSNLGFIKDYSINELAKAEQEKYDYVFTKHYPKNLHRYNYMAQRFRDGVLLIKNKYDSDASKIWSGNPSAGTVARRFEEFSGVGQKISTMAAKLLGSKFNIKFSHYRDLDIPVDRQVRKVMFRLGLVKYAHDEKQFKKNIISKTREWNPDYPGLFDYPCFGAGIGYCHNENPDCQNCILKEICSKNI